MSFLFFFFKNFGEHTNTSKVSIQTDTSPKNSLKHSQIICYFTTNFIEIRQIVRFRQHCRKTSKRKRDRGFNTARNKHTKTKYSNDETENDQLFFERCKALVRLSRADF